MNLSESIVCPVRTAASRDPDRVAISTPDRDIGYAELDGAVGATARRMTSLGLSGRRIGVYMPRSAVQISLVFAAIRAGSVVVQVPTRVPYAGVPNFLRRAGCTTLVTDAGDSGLPEIRTIPPEELIGGDPAREPVSEEPLIPLARPATVVFTSGSTGPPKAALHTFGNHYASALGSGRNIPLGPGDVWLHSLPLFHVGGLSILFRCAVAGATMALPATGESTGESIARSGATHVSLVATQLLRLLDEDADLSGVGAVLLGGSGIPETLLDRAFDAGIPVHTSYGLTEMASQVTTTSPDSGRAELATSGRVLPNRELRISDEAEILVRGDTLFSGYLDGADVHLPLDGDGWFHTGDLGEMSDGLLTVTGRLDNMFVSGGENIQPEEVEEEIRRIEGVEDAVVVPIPDREFGERPVAFVKGRTAARIIAAKLRETLPGFKVPIAFHSWPKDAPDGMKVDRGFFRKRAGENAAGTG